MCPHNLNQSPVKLTWGKLRSITTNFGTELPHIRSTKGVKYYFDTCTNGLGIHCKKLLKVAFCAKWDGLQFDFAHCGSNR